MNVLFIVLATILIVAALTFLIPWASKKIEEPFVSVTCEKPDTRVAELPAPPADPDFRDRVLEGQQKYNRLALADVAKYGPNPTTNTVGGDMVSQGGLGGVGELNSMIRQALESVEILPTTVSLTPDTPDVKLNMVTGDSGTSYISTTNPYGIRTSGNPQNLNFIGKAMSYVEERLRGRPAESEPAKKCERVNLYRSGTDTNGQAIPRSAPINRIALCDELGKNTDLENTDLVGCGVCIKGGVSYSTTANTGVPAGKQFIGGMKATSSAAPEFGTCAPGYFFKTGEVEQCKAAARRVNCEEFGESGGFMLGGTAADGTSNAADLSCVSCARSPNQPYVYYNSYNSSGQFNPQSIQFRIVVPKGSGKNQIFYTINGIQNSITVNASNTIGGFQLSEVKPGSVIAFEVFQEFPHRPRGVSEVFYVPSLTDISYTDAVALAAKLGCAVATKVQLQSAWDANAQVCSPGWASDEKAYTVHKYTNFQTSMCSYGSTGDLTGPVEATVTGGKTKGVWVYGIKPDQSYISKATQGVTGSTTVFDPKIQNFYNWIGLNDETFIGPANSYIRDDKAFQAGVTNGAPNYRGILIQMEGVPAATGSDVTSRRRESVEPFLTKVGTTAIRGTLAERLASYKRKGTFGTSQMITSPRPSDAPLMDENQYWIWGVDDKTPSFSFEIKVPGYFLDPADSADLAKCNTGILITDKDSLQRYALNPCEKGIDENDASGCLKFLFLTAGGKDAGTLNPSKSLENRRTLMYEDTANRTGQRTESGIREFLTTIASRAQGKGISDSVTKTERADLINGASKLLYGYEQISPCHTIVDAIDVNGKKTYNYVPKTAPFDASCLDYLYRRTTVDNAQLLLDPTYTNIGQKYSGLSPFDIASEKDKTDHPYTTCQPTGSWAPLYGDGTPNTDAVTQINSTITTLCGADGCGTSGKPVTDLAAAIQAFNAVYTDANSSTNFDAQSVAIDRCYGIKRKVTAATCNGIVASAIRILASVYQNKDGRTCDTTLPSTISVNSKPAVEFTSTYTVPSDITSVESVTLMSYDTGAVADCKDGIVVQLLNASTTVLAQRVLTNTTTGKVVFTSEDVRPLVPYTNIFAAGKIAGVGLKFRFESAIYPNLFLNWTEATLDQDARCTVMGTNDAANAFQLVKNKSELPDTSPVYSITPSGKTDVYWYAKDGFLNYGNEKTLTTDQKSYLAWAIRPALNGASGYICIESANYPGFYLFPKRMADNTIKVVLKNIPSPTDQDKFKTCWRLHPVL
jgi:hypothetical protein